MEKLERGEGDNALVLIHASATGPGAYAGFADEVVSHGFRLIAPALTGYGHQRIDAGQDGLVRNVEIAAEAVRSTTARRRCLFGHSMGGLVALLAASQLAGSVDLPDALILYDPILIGLLDPNVPEEKAALDWDRAIIAKLQSAVEAGDPETGVRTFVEAWNETEWEAIPAKVRNGLVSMADHLVRETNLTTHHKLDLAALRQLSLPVLILNGEMSPSLNHLTSRTLADLLPQSDRVEVPSAGHMGPLMNAGKIADVISVWLREKFHLVSSA